MKKTIGKKLSIKTPESPPESIFIPDFDFRMWITNEEGILKISTPTENRVIKICEPGSKIGLLICNFREKDLYSSFAGENLSGINCEMIHYTTDVKIAGQPFLPHISISPTNQILPMNRSLHQLFSHIDRIFSLGGKFEVEINKQKYLYLANFGDLEVIFSDE